MKIFIDASNLQDIQKLVPLGIIDGITTNPSLLAKNPATTAKFSRKSARSCGPDQRRVVETEARR
jgi:transaldolase